jgi:hypothetical protein
VKLVLAGMMVGVLGIAVPSIAQGVPDVVGIKPGMSPQEAYNLLKVRANGAKIGIAQMMMPAITDKPVAVLMSVRPLDVSPAETIAVWLTLPPNKQQVWAIGRTLQLDQDKGMLKSVAEDGLRQKYGMETDRDFWAFDEQGGRLPAAGMHMNNCMGIGRMDLTAPDNPSSPPPTTPLIYAPEPENFCSNVVSVRSQFGGVTSGNSATVGSITVIVQDTPLARRSQQAYQAALASADATKRKEELEKAKQQKAPSF